MKMCNFTINKTASVNLILFFILAISTTSCSNPCVYKIIRCDTPGLNSEFLINSIFVKELSNHKEDPKSKGIKEKICLHLNAKGYRAICEMKNSPRYYLLFSWETEVNTKQSVIPIYEPGTTAYNSGSIYGYDGSLYSYSGTSTTSGSIKTIPYKYNVYSAYLKVYVFDAHKFKIDPSPSSIVWSSCSFLDGKEAKNIDGAINYLIMTAFDRFGCEPEGAAEQYEFKGTEKELKALKAYDNDKNKIIKRGFQILGD